MKTGVVVMYMSYLSIYHRPTTVIDINTSLDADVVIVVIYSCTIKYTPVIFGVREAVVINSLHQSSQLT